jgi:CubicO group peptidase (beta-lactamase class C family)
MYSGGGMTVMQLLLTDVTGKDFPTLMRERVLGPVGMHTSSWEQPLSDQRARDAAAGHQTTGAPVEGKYHVYPELAAAGLWTTPTDLASWVQAIQRSLQGEAEARAVQGESVLARNDSSEKTKPARNTSRSPSSSVPYSRDPYMINSS